MDWIRGHINMLEDHTNGAGCHITMLRNHYGGVGGHTSMLGDHMFCSGFILTCLKVIGIGLEDILSC